MASVVLIRTYINDKLNKGEDLREISKSLGVGFTTVYNYKEGLANPSLKTAKKIYELDKVAIHPYGEENLRLELKFENE